MAAVYCLSLGVSNQTRELTHLPNLADPARKPSDPMLAMVGCGSPIPKPETGGSVDGLKHGKLIFNRPDRKSHRKQLSPPIEVVHRSILSDLSRFGEISSRSGQISSRSRCISLRSGLIQLRSTEISSRFGLISLRSTKISLKLGQSSKKAKFGDDLHSSSPTGN